jgi:mannose-6-phosphate isomerase
MSLEHQEGTGPISLKQPSIDASADEWVAWFWADFFPVWIQRARDPRGIGFYDLLDNEGQPPANPSKTTLAQARLLFTFSHLALISGNPVFRDAAKTAREALPYFRKPSGLYRRGLNGDGSHPSDTESQLATSYDQTFLILSLSTWGQLELAEDTDLEMESIWSAIEDQLVDPATGLLLEHDNVSEPADPTAPNPAQNPHMHLYEACLQAFEMSRRPVWMERAQRMRAKGLEYFFDTDSGTITEFIAPDLSILPGRDGERREIGHQCEWAWLLLREVELGGDVTMTSVANRLLTFADQHGFASSGSLKGAAFDAVSADTSWREARFLLWPQTEAIKTYAVRAQEGDNADKAKALVQVIFREYFAGRSAFVNQLDETGQVLWPEALSRLHYHLVLALTEGARAGIWKNPE